MKLTTCEQMREMDEAAVGRFGIPGLLLMENAARSVFDAIRNIEAYIPKKAAVLCGVGNNGGDGFAIARHMFNDGADVLVVVVGEPGKITGDARVNYEICRKMGLIGDFAPDALRDGYPLIVDAMLGTGVSGGLREPVREAVAAVNGQRENGAYIVAVDCPTGGDPDTGRVSDICVRADLTVTLALTKAGLLLYPLAEYTGRIEVGGISMPGELLDELETDMYALDESLAAELLPKRHECSHKGTYGRVAVVAGSAGMTGAAAFCADAAYKAGCGYVDVNAPRTAIPVIQQLVPQAISTPLPEKGGFVCADALDTALAQINKATVCLLGPGLGQTEDVREFVRGVITGADVPLVLDADALNAIAGQGADILREAKVPPVITPHPLEMSRLTGVPAARILDDMIGEARKFAAVYNTVTVLKSAATVIADPNGRVFINKGACSALAKAGSGDILAGLIAGFIAQGADGAEVAALGCYIQSKAGKAAAARYGDYSVGYAEVLGCVHEAIIPIFNKTVTTA
ncbi:MAG: NAD(P)H-hydrate dehydratase [Defluviitaleaceae bacterium]|nr:NAD(P)H-hydrate dehydratase [Defluviitaleaceae bacterium]